MANVKEKQMARFVLVHGGFSGAWIWLSLMDRLKAHGHSVEAFVFTDSRRNHLQAPDSQIGKIVLEAASFPESKR